MKTRNLLSLSLSLSLLFVLASLLNASTPSLPVEIKMTAEYTGHKQVKLNVELSSEEISDVRIRVNASKGTLDKRAVDGFEGKLVAGQTSSYQLDYYFDDYNEYAYVNVTVAGSCEDCNTSLTNEEGYCIIFLKSAPWVTTYTKLYERLLNDEQFAGQLGYIAGKSKLHKGGKGLFDYRAAGMSLEEAKKAHDRMFGRIGEEVDESNVTKTKSKSNFTTLSSVVTRSGRITYNDTQYGLTFGMPRCSVAVVVYYAPAYEETWGYALTDYDGYYTVNFNIPSGQTIYEQLVGIMVHTEDTDADIMVKDVSTGYPYMCETITNSNYNFLTTFYLPARLHYALMQSYIVSNSNGYGGGGVTLVIDEYCASCYTTAVIHFGNTRASSQATQEVVFHEHGHHILHTKAGAPTGAGGDWAFCDTIPAGRAFDEGWAEFWSYMATPSTFVHTYFDSYEPNNYCSGIKYYCFQSNVTRALWDLYDGAGSADEYNSFWSKMDEAMTSTIDDVYDYVEKLKDQYQSEVISALIDTTIYLNLPHPQQLMLASELNDEHPILPQAYSLDQNYPNPFNPSTSISFTLPQPSSNLTLKVYDVRGKVVKVLSGGAKEAGNYTVFWDGTDENGNQVSSGVYLYRLAADGFNETRKMVLLK